MLEHHYRPGLSSVTDERPLNEATLPVLEERLCSTAAERDGNISLAFSERPVAAYQGHWELKKGKDPKLSENLGRRL